MLVGRVMPLVDRQSSIVGATVNRQSSIGDVMPGRGADSEEWRT
jgi:hypothetical protein